MRLLKLAANMETFRTITFRRQGLSLVVAEQHRDTASPTATYNGVGKSLMFAIIHYCLGSNRNEAFARHLKGWVFFLTLELDGKQHVVSRSADKSSEISIDGEEISLPKLREFLQIAAFGLPPSTKVLTFRSLISRFIRSGRAAYNEFSIADDGEQKQPYQAMLRSAYLLGLDLNLARTKYELRVREQQLTETMKLLQKDPLFAELLAEDTVELELTTLHEEAIRLKNDLRSFRVADDYHEIEIEADRVKRELDKARRSVIKLGEAVAQIDRSLLSKGDLPLDRVLSLYTEARAALPDNIRRRIEEVIAFQQDLQHKRVYRLTQERQRLLRDKAASQQQISSLSTKLDHSLQYLSEHRALDEYAAVAAKLSDANQRITRLEESKSLRDKVDKELKTISRDLANGNIETDEYLDSAKSLIYEASAMFRGFATELYGTRKSGLTVTNDSGSNQQRYKIDAHITADAAEGINEAKIFCFDMTLLSLGRGHQLKFLAHDSTLFSPIDPRQRLSMFRIARRICVEQDLQYIAALNHHDISSIESQVVVSDEELSTLFGEESVVLKLTDESPTRKLLGIEVDMNYT